MKSERSFYDKVMNKFRLLVRTIIKDIIMVNWVGATIVI